MTSGRDAAQRPTWYAATAVARPDHERLTFDIDTDVCVVGGGLAGLTTARELALRGWSVAVLEAGRVGDGASGRNCGFVLPGFGQTMAQIAERGGAERARELWTLADAGRAYVRDTIRESGMPGVDPVDGWLHVAKFAERHDWAEEADALRRRYGADIDLWPTERVRDVLRTPHYFNAVCHRNAFHIHPLNYTLGLAAAAEAAGVRIFEATRALSLDTAGVRKRVTTAAGRVRAGHIVLAGNVALGPLLPRLAATLLPLTTFVAVTAPLGARLHEAIGYAGAVSDTERADNHYRIIDGDRLLWSGGMRAWPAEPARFAARLRADIRRVYPQLGNVDIDHVWSGTLGRTVHRMPQIGQLSPGLWVASGFGGRGLNTTAMAGVLIARAIIEGDASWRAFAPYELVWAGGLAGRLVAQTCYAGSRLRDRAKFMANSRRSRSSRRSGGDPRRSSSVDAMGIDGEILPGRAALRRPTLLNADLDGMGEMQPRPEPPPGRSGAAMEQCGSVTTRATTSGEVA